MREVRPGTADFGPVLALAARVLAQDRHLASRLPHALESHVIAAFDGTQCGCYQMRTRSPVTSTGNYAAKIAAGYGPAAQ